MDLFHSLIALPFTPGTHPSSFLTRFFTSCSQFSFFEKKNKLNMKRKVTRKWCGLNKRRNQSGLKRKCCCPTSSSLLQFFIKELISLFNTTSSTRYTLCPENLRSISVQVVDQPEVVRFAAAAGSVIIRKDDISNEAFSILTGSTTKNSTLSFPHSHNTKIYIGVNSFNLVEKWNNLSWNNYNFHSDLCILLLSCGKGEILIYLLNSYLLSIQRRRNPPSYWPSLERM